MNMKILLTSSAIALGAAVICTPVSAQLRCDLNGVPGVPSVTQGTNSLVCGDISAASGPADNLTAVGADLSFSGDNVTILGSNVWASTGASNSVSPFAVPVDLGATAVGSYSFAAGEGSVALGDQAGVGLVVPFGVGGRTINPVDGGTAVGSHATVTGANGTAIGFGSAASGNGTVAVGSGADASGTFSTAIGIDAVASGDLSVVVGRGSTSTANGSVVIGNSLTADFRDSILIGNALGSAMGQNAISIGSNADALSENAIAIGRDASATGSAVAIGTGQVAVGDGAVAIGDPNSAVGTGAVAIGADNTATGDGAVALGNNNIASSAGAVAIGNAALANGTSGVAIGNGASNATFANSVALGNGTVNTAANQVHVGGRTIGGVAAGVLATDAVNVSQLNAAAADISALEGAVVGLQGDVSTLFDLRSEDRRDMKQGVAAAMAMAQAPLPSTPGGISYAVNGATFRGEYAVGGSLSYRLNTEAPLAINVGASFAGNKNNGARIGIAGEF